MTLQNQGNKDTDPRQCRICREMFSEPWMAERCQAQGSPHIEYHVLDVMANQRGRLFVCSFYSVHHGIGVKCDIEGPCPHDVTYHGYELVPMWFGDQHAWISAVGGFRRNSFQPGWEKITTLTQRWGVIPEDGDPSLYLTEVDPPGEWEKLWGFYPERRGRRGGRRLEGL